MRTHSACLTCRHMSSTCSSTSTKLVGHQGYADRKGVEQWTWQISKLCARQVQGTQCVVSRSLTCKYISSRCSSKYWVPSLSAIMGMLTMTALRTRQMLSWPSSSTSGSSCSGRRHVSNSEHSLRWMHTLSQSCRALREKVMSKRTEVQAIACMQGCMPISSASWRRSQSLSCTCTTCLQPQLKGNSHSGFVVLLEVL